MKNCKNIECKNLVVENRTYCSLKCRNVYVNKYIRNYDKCSETQKRKHTIKYVKKNCIQCGNEIPYEYRKNKFCNHSCAASFSNLGRIESEKTKEKKRLIISSKLKQKGFLDFKKTKCKNCGFEFYTKESTGKRYCNKTCKIEFQRKDLSDYENYRLDAKFKFKIFDYPNEFDLSLIEKHGIYKAKNRGDNMNGISRDHMYSIRDGFDNKIDVNLISHPANCRLIFQRDNAIKHRKSIITVEELNERINNWKEKHEK